MMNSKIASFLAICVFVVVIVGETEVANAAVTCNPVQLSPCASAISSSGNPSQLCCARLKEQKPCLCQYLKNPNFQKYINSPGAKKVASACGTPFPKC